MERWEAIRQRVDAALRYAGLSQEELIAQVKFSRSTYNRRRDGKYEWEEGKLYEVAKACGVPLWFLAHGWDGWRVETSPAELRQIADGLPTDGEPND